MTRSKDELEEQFGLDPIALMEEIQRLEAEAESKPELYKIYGTNSPNARGHASLQNFEDCGTESERIARQFADMYLGMEPKKNIHADDEAAAVWRWVSDWEYVDGYPKTQEEVAKMREDYKKEKK